MDPLHELIQGMSPSEKGYFKKYASPQSEKDYVKLFDAIAAQEVYDEEKLIRKLKNAPVVKHLSRNKNYLFNAIVKSLLLYQEESLPKVVASNLLNEADLLFGRGMMAQARKRVDKAKEIVRKGEWFALWIEALNHQGRLIDYKIYSPAEMDTTALNVELKDVIARMSNLYGLIAIHKQQEKIGNASFLFRKDQEKKLKDFQHHKLPASEEDATSLRAKLMFNYSHHLNRLLLHEHRAALVFAKRYLALVTGNTEFTVANPAILLQAYNLVITVLQFLPEPVQHEKYLNELRKVEITGTWLQSAKFQYYSAQALYFYYTHYRKPEFLEIAAETEKNLVVFANIMKVDLRLGMYVTLAEGYIKFGEYAKAIDIVEVYRQNPPKEIRHDYQNTLMFSYAIAQYEKGNHQMVRNLLANMSQFMKRVEEFSEIENLMLKVFATVLDVPDKRTRNLALGDLNSKIKKIASDTGKARWLEYVSLISPFIESRIKGIKYHEFVLRNR